MKQLRYIIQQLILESVAKDYFDEAWFNTEEERPQQQWDKLRSMVGTFHKDKLKQKKLRLFAPGVSDKDIDTLFKGKRDLKKLWNETIDKFNLRSFWENNEDIVYFHSLTYYDGTNSTDASLQQDIIDEPLNISVSTFIQTYDLKNNKDEMSTFGVHNGQSFASDREREEGFLLKGRVTFASSSDAWVESRSKGSFVDMNRHKSSGMPKRILPSSYNIGNLLFDETDILENSIGECILDNWSIVGYVYKPYGDPQQLEATLKWCAQNKIKTYTKEEIFK